MANNLIFYETVKEVSSAVASVLTTFQLMCGVNKRDMAVLKESIRIFKAEYRVINCGQLVRQCIEEIDKTIKKIESLKLSGIALEMAMEQLSWLQGMLEKNLKEYLWK